MTRVSSYTLYQCPSCGQVHIKNEYGSVSIYVPTDLYFEPTDTKSCKKCGKTHQVQDFICLGMRSKTIRVEKNYKKTMLGKLHRWVYEFIYPSKDIDLSHLYPYI